MWKICNPFSFIAELNSSLRRLLENNFLKSNLKASVCTSKLESITLKWVSPLSYSSSLIVNVKVGLSTTWARENLDYCNCLLPAIKSTGVTTFKGKKRIVPWASHSICNISCGKKASTVKVLMTGSKSNLFFRVNNKW